MWLSSNIEREKLEEKSRAGVCKSMRKRRILVKSCRVIHDSLVCRSWRPVSQLVQGHVISPGPKWPNRGRGDAHNAGHTKCYLSSAKGGFCTVVCRGQLHLGWVFRSASEGTSMKSSSRVHPLHLPWFLVVHGVRHQGQHKFSKSWHQHGSWASWLLSEETKPQSSPAQVEMCCFMWGFITSLSPDPAAVTPLELGRPHPTPNSCPLRHASSPPRTPDVAALWETRA